MLQPGPVKYKVNYNLHASDFKQSHSENVEVGVETTLQMQVFRLSSLGTGYAVLIAAHLQSIPPSRYLHDRSFYFFYGKSPFEWYI